MSFSDGFEFKQINSKLLIDFYIDFYVKLILFMFLDRIELNFKFVSKSI